ncbi:MAG TPA: 2OG-Fe(II) oxygenase [Blastocatellia bacterium]|nr:2OG-Fe(II) oxygenase [Blastocatellia bacterium]HMV84475.1 2OG-Fe(II) oxygenase [Blastocatellia bacterium]HMY73047.1 2OG-Fe(II) oxygenase [Blastocatellia bacterium]HMZ18868.1 2OG-Fe(II) oxygenase [Blastocatellia bacterium]HNG30223.1 2OG-Fe(II) oxygenase [Blastocatellia bacterium]
MNRFAEAVADIAAQGWTVKKDFLPPETIAALRTEAEQLRQGDEFRSAGIGRSDGYALRPDIRGDHIRWLDEHAPTPAQKVYWEAIEELRGELNRELFLSLATFEAHLAIYPPGAFYQKHLDRFSDADERLISCTLYLNDNWQAEAGGQLRLYLPEGSVDVLPEAGTCALFRSDIFFHEVLPATKTRFSLTGWFRRRSLKLL